MTEPNQSASRRVNATVGRRATPTVNRPPVEPDSTYRAKAAQFDLGRFVHRALRGKYGLAIVFGLITGSLAAFIGFKLGHPFYHSEGLVRIAYTLPEVSQETDQNRPMAMFDTFMQSQKLLITSRPVIDMAIQDPIWKAKGFQVPPEPDRYFARHLTVEIKPRSEYIQIAVTDSDPGTAATAVNAIINAYTDRYNNQDKQLERARIGVLDDRRIFLEGRIQSLKSDLGLAVKEYGSTKLDMLYMSAEQRLTKLDSAMNDVRLAMATAPSRPQEIQAGQQKNAGPSSSGQELTPDQLKMGQGSAELTIDQISGLDPSMKSLLEEQAKLQGELESFQAQGLKPGHRLVITANLSLKQLQTRIDREADVFRRFHAATSQSIGDPRNAPVLTAGKSREMLATNLTSLTELYKEAKTDMIRIGNKRYELQQTESELDALVMELNLKKHRIEVLKDEGALGGRLSVVGTAEPPLSPDKDPRLLIAAGAGLGGFCLPAGAIVLLSLLRRRYHYSDETQTDEMTKLPLLGILPELGEGVAVDQMLAASHSIHHIRVLLEAHAAHNGSRVYLLTSANPGEGKTSLTMSLGLSFAAARMRTLVIDCDLVGRRLSSALDAKDLQGFNEALESGSIRQLVRKTKSGLFILPAGNAAAADACTISGEAVRCVLDEARRYFDVVLVDSGPILGSVEAAVVAQQVDSVIFTIARGQHRSAVQNATRRLYSLGVRLEGCIFNRAKAQDFDRSPYASSSRSASDDGSGSKTLPYNPESAGRLGPLVHAVVAGLPAGAN